MRFVSAFCFLFTALIVKADLSHKDKAILDLVSWNPSEQPILSLNGKWEMYWNKLLSPTDFKKDTALTPDLFTEPRSWSETKLNGTALNSKGFATYRMFIRNLPATSLMLDVYSVQTSCRIFINDSLVLEIGKPGTTGESTSPMNSDALINIPGNAKNVELIVQIANFHHRKGGFVRPFGLGLAPAVTRNHMLHYLLQVIETSSLFIIGLFLLALYIFRRKDLSILWFSLFCISLAFRPVIAVNYFLATLFTGINWYVMLKIEYLAVLLPCMFMLLFIKKLFPEQLSSTIVKLLVGVLLVKIGITLLFPPSVFSWLIPPLLVVILIGVTVFAITILRAVTAKVEGSFYAGIGLVILLCSLVLKVLTYANVIPQADVVITTLDIGFIFTMSLILGARFSIQFVKVERLQQITEIQRQEIEQKKAAIEDKNKSIIDSINYARRIQTSLLPTEKYIAKVFRNLKR